MAKTDDSSTEGETAFGVKVPKMLMKPIGGFASKLFSWLGDNPTVVILLIVIGAMAWGVYDVVPSQIDAIHDGHKDQSQLFIEASREARKEFTADVKSISDMHAADDKRAAALITEMRDMIKEMREMVKQSWEMLRERERNKALNDNPLGPIDPIAGVPQP